MRLSDLFEIATPGLFHGCYLAEVVSVQDPDSLTRVQVRLFNADGVDGQDGPIWARVAAPFAGSQRGAFMLPDVGDEVLISFLQGDSRLPVVIGGLWNGNAAPPDSLGGDRVDRWMFVGKAGTKIAITEQSASEATITLSTPGGVKATLTDSGGGKVEIICSSTTIKIDSSGVSIQTGSKVAIQASKMDISAGQVNVDAALSKFSGIVKCDVLQATTVVATTYTPGAGNTW
jgi:uncharacterized protein involved in type VI secretion and phage assembly